LKGILIRTIYVVVKRFPTLSNLVYFSLRHVNLITQDNTTKILFLRIASTTIWLTKKEIFIWEFASQLSEEHYLQHAILKISYDNDDDDHVFGATFWTFTDSVSTERINNSVWEIDYYQVALGVVKPLRWRHAPFIVMSHYWRHNIWVHLNAP
jgi:hypothetical protein